MTQEIWSLEIHTLPFFFLGSKRLESQWLKKIDADKLVTWLLRRTRSCSSLHPTPCRGPTTVFLPFILLHVVLLCRMQTNWMCFKQMRDTQLELFWEICVSSLEDSVNLNLYYGTGTAVRTNCPWSPVNDFLRLSLQGVAGSVWSPLSLKRKSSFN